MRVPTISLGALLKRIVLAVAAVQGATLLGLVVVDYRRKRLRKPVTFPRLPPSSVTVGGSEVTVYTYGEDLYRDMLNAISQAKSRIFFESFIWKSDAVGQAFKDALIDAAKVLFALDLHPARGAGLLHALGGGAFGRIKGRGGLAARCRGDGRGEALVR